MTRVRAVSSPVSEFPFLFGGTFIEAKLGVGRADEVRVAFPFLFGGTFIEASSVPLNGERIKFPFLFGGTFIEAGYTAYRWYRVGTRISLPFRRDFH